MKEFKTAASPPKAQLARGQQLCVVIDVSSAVTASAGCAASHSCFLDLPVAHLLLSKQAPPFWLMLLGSITSYSSDESTNAPRNRAAFSFLD
jgi:hypothetical protein